MGIPTSQHTTEKNDANSHVTEQVEDCLTELQHNTQSETNDDVTERMEKTPVGIPTSLFDIMGYASESESEDDCKTGWFVCCVTHAY